MRKEGRRALAGRGEGVGCGGLGALPAKGSGPRVVLVSQKANWANVYEKARSQEEHDLPGQLFRPVTAPDINSLFINPGKRAPLPLSFVS